MVIRGGLGLERRTLSGFPLGSVAPQSSPEDDGLCSLSAADETSSVAGYTPRRLQAASHCQSPVLQPDTSAGDRDRDCARSMSVLSPQAWRRCFGSWLTTDGSSLSACERDSQMALQTSTASPRQRVRNRRSEASGTPRMEWRGNT
ncbi:hypothetical protein SKAU_G00034150 [Synaphobranchus kaupii]|uniref:Uncharacterized protein n=1 Tax=Synaphobranchus kaupii TaxID=118154 RepID=A0A9Q1GGH4_SYNKA|nr:hypothetical protein SKAU_G00034150 [Synaphobranchus kaupii]